MVKRSRYVDDYEEDTDIYETTHVDPIALNHVFDIVKRLRKGKGFVGPQYEWYDKACPSYRCVVNSFRLSNLLTEAARTGFSFLTIHLKFM